MQNTLRTHCDGANGRKPHMPPWKIINQLGYDCWNDYFKFLFVRNPWDHFVSYWFWRRAIKVIPNDKSLKELAFEVHPGDFFNPWLFHEDKLCIDYIGKLETMQEDYHKIRSILSLPSINIPNIRSNYKRKRDYQIYYEGDVELIERVRELYVPDIIDYLGYDYNDYLNS
jgi:hypothetical protein